ncbi:MAG: MerR family transcriptional regulator [Steroidobacteraceae bacterium]
MHAPRLTIGRLSALAKCSVPTIRYYEEIGLLPPASREASGHRTYDAADVRRLAFARRYRKLGFSIKEVRDLLALAQSPARNCDEACTLTQAHLDTVREKLAELRSLEKTLTRFVNSCQTQCAGGPAPKCTILEDLARPPVVPDSAGNSSCCKR